MYISLIFKKIWKPSPASGTPPPGPLRGYHLISPTLVDLDSPSRKIPAAATENTGLTNRLHYIIILFNIFSYSKNSKLFKNYINFFTVKFFTEFSRKIGKIFPASGGPVRDSTSHHQAYSLIDFEFRIVSTGSAFLCQ